MPQEVRDKWDLAHLLNECVRPTTPQGRWKVKDKLIDAFKHLRKSYDSNNVKVHLFKGDLSREKPVVTEDKHVGNWGSL